MTPQSYVSVAPETHTGQDIEAIYEREIYEIEMVDSFESLLYHKVLRIGDYKIRGLPSSIARLQHLNELYTEQNLISELPCSFGQLRIRFLFLQHNRLRLLPETFGDLPLLQHMRLDHNELTVLPNNFGHLTTLKWLELQGNVLQRLPDSFCRLSNLQRLKIEDNRLVEFPAEFGRLESLQAVTAASNCIAALPESFPELLSLQHLSIELNRLSHLPENFGQLESLETLCLGGNRIRSLPASFGMLKSLQTCSLGPLNRLRVAYPRICWMLGLGYIEHKGLPQCDKDCAHESSRAKREPSPEVIGNASKEGTSTPDESDTDE